MIEFGHWFTTKERWMTKARKDFFKINLIAFSFFFLVIFVFLLFEPLYSDSSFDLVQIFAKTAIFTAIAMSFVFIPMLVLSTKNRGGDPFRYSGKLIRYYFVPYDFNGSILSKKLSEERGDFEKNEFQSNLFSLTWRNPAPRMPSEKGNIRVRPASQDRRVKIKLLETTSEGTKISIEFIQERGLGLMDNDNLNIIAADELELFLNIKSFSKSVDDHGQPIW